MNISDAFQNMGGPELNAGRGAMATLSQLSPTLKNLEIGSSQANDVLESIVHTFQSLTNEGQKLDITNANSLKTYKDRLKALVQGNLLDQKQLDLINQEINAKKKDVTQTLENMKLGQQFFEQRARHLSLQKQQFQAEKQLQMDSIESMRKNFWGPFGDMFKGSQLKTLATIAGSSITKTLTTAIKGALDVAFNIQGALLAKKGDEMTSLMIQSSREMVKGLLETAGQAAKSFKEGFKETKEKYYQNQQEKVEKRFSKTLEHLDREMNRSENMSQILESKMNTSFTDFRDTIKDFKKYTQIATKAAQTSDDAAIKLKSAGKDISEESGSGLSVIKKSAAGTMSAIGGLMRALPQIGQGVSIVFRSMLQSVQDAANTLEGLEIKRRDMGTYFEQKYGNFLRPVNENGERVKFDKNGNPINPAYDKFYGSYWSQGWAPPGSAITNPGAAIWNATKQVGGSIWDMMTGKTPTTPPSSSTSISPTSYSPTSSGRGKLKDLAIQFPNGNPQVAKMWNVITEAANTVSKTDNLNVPPSTLLALLQTESSFNPNARSQTGALGLGQFTEPTARQYGLITGSKVQGNFSDLRTNPQLSAIASAEYLGDLLKQNNGSLYQAYSKYKGVGVGGATTEDAINAVNLAKKYQDYAAKEALKGNTALLGYKGEDLATATQPLRFAAGILNPFLMLGGGNFGLNAATNPSGLQNGGIGVTSQTEGTGANLTDTQKTYLTMPTAAQTVKWQQGLVNNQYVGQPRGPKPKAERLTGGAQLFDYATGLTEVTWQLRDLMHGIHVEDIEKTMDALVTNFGVMKEAFKYLPEQVKFNKAFNLNNEEGGKFSYTLKSIGFFSNNITDDFNRLSKQIQLSNKYGGDFKSIISDVVKNTSYMAQYSGPGIVKAFTDASAKLRAMGMELKQIQGVQQGVTSPEQAFSTAFSLNTMLGTNFNPAKMNIMAMMANPRDFLNYIMKGLKGVNVNNIPPFIWNSLSQLMGGIPPEQLRTMIQSSNNGIPQVNTQFNQYSSMDQLASQAASTSDKMQFKQEQISAQFGQAVDVFRQVSDKISDVLLGLQGSMSSAIMRGFGSVAQTLGLKDLSSRLKQIGPEMQKGNIMGGGSHKKGGFIRGPGTSTSDSIPARLSDGEYVLSAADVRAWGGPEVIDKMRNIKGFKNGGHIDFASLLHPTLSLPKPASSTTNVHHGKAKFIKLGNGLEVPINGFDNGTISQGKPIHHPLENIHNIALAGAAGLMSNLNILGLPFGKYRKMEEFNKRKYKHNTSGNIAYGIGEYLPLLFGLGEIATTAKGAFEGSELIGVPRVLEAFGEGFGESAAKTGHVIFDAGEKAYNILSGKSKTKSENLKNLWKFIMPSHKVPHFANGTVPNGGIVPGFVSTNSLGNNFQVEKNEDLQVMNSSQKIKRDEKLEGVMSAIQDNTNAVNNLIKTISNGGGKKIVLHVDGREIANTAYEGLL